MDKIQQTLLEQIADLHGVPEGAYNIRSDGATAARGHDGEHRHSHQDGQGGHRHLHKARHEERA